MDMGERIAGKQDRPKCQLRRYIYTPVHGIDLGICLLMTVSSFGMC